MNKKLLLSFLLMLMLSVVLVACGGGNDTDNNADGNNNNGDAEADAPDFLSFLTGGTSGTYYPLGGAIATIISDETGIQTDAVSSNASADNIEALRDGEAEIAFTQTDVASNAVEGINSFDGDPVDNVLGLGALYPETIQIVTTDKSGIESVEDMEGKKVSVGAPGSGTYVNAEQILEVHGLSMDDIDAQNLDFGESTGGIQDGNIDAAFITAGTPTGAVEELQASADVSIVPVEKDKADELIEEYPYYAEDTVEEGTYDIEEDVDTVAVLAMIVVTDDIPEDTVYDITKAIYENTDDIAHDKADAISKDSALDGLGDLELHPGAEKYYEEEGIEAE
ncbi:MAG TPA: TAXI family TRAP transporter solute-binding subunit [Pseudogracilibacillus sp.]|nr:TAXI family TRAP transporter solute-binding subunit [Pseudogracilibacillus sp.]